MFIKNKVVTEPCRDSKNVWLRFCDGKLNKIMKIQYTTDIQHFVVSTHTSIFSNPEKIILKSKLWNEIFRKNYTFAETLKYAILASSSSGARSQVNLKLQPPFAKGSTPSPNSGYFGNAILQFTPYNSYHFQLQEGGSAGLSWSWRTKDPGNERFSSSRYSQCPSFLSDSF